MIDRRYFSSTLAQALVGAALLPLAGRQAWATGTADFTQQMAAIEQASGGRMGVAILDTASGARVGWREDERFALCSTFKALAVGALLARVDRGRESLERRLVFQRADLVSYSPETEKHVGEPGMRLADICEAAITLSDNTAANLIYSCIGGPQGLTAYLRSLGDAHTRLDRLETELNDVGPGDERDTTTPRAMATTLHRLLLGGALSSTSRAQLLRWLEASRTGNDRLRAGLPKEWRVGDKTGTGYYGTANDVAIVMPPERAPLIVTVYLTGATVPMAQCNAAIARVGALAAQQVQKV